MPDKLTDKIKKALECCKKDDCDNCPNDFGNCYANLARYALDLINRLQAENENLNAEVGKMVAENERLKTNLNIELENFATEYDSKIKAEAYKECIEKVKALFPSYNEPYQYWEIHEGADNLLKELVGDGDGN